MGSPLSIEISEHGNVQLPAAALHQMNLHPGDHMLIDFQDGVLVMLPRPSNYVAMMAGLHRDVWEGIDATQYLEDERAAWIHSSTG